MVLCGDWRSRSCRVIFVREFRWRQLSWRQQPVVRGRVEGRPTLTENHQNSDTAQQGKKSDPTQNQPKDDSLIARTTFLSGDDFRTPYIWRTHINGNHHDRLSSTPSSRHHTNQSDPCCLPQAFQCPYPPLCYRSCCPVIGTQSISSTSNCLIFTHIPGQKADDKCL